MTDRLPSLPETNWRTRTDLIGGLLGLMIGLLSAYLYARAAEENKALQPGRIKTMDALRLSVALLAIVRQITDLGARGDKS